MNEEILTISKNFWKAIEKSDGAVMRAIADPECWFVHIGGNCSLDEEVHFYEDGIFKPTGVTLHDQKLRIFGDTAVVVTDCDYGLLLDGKPTTHHFAVTEIYKKKEESWKLIQFTFTALVY